LLDKGGGQGDCVLTVNVGRQESVIEPADYGRWRDSRLGSLTESIEQRAVLGFCGNLSGRRVLDLGCGDGNYALRASEDGAFAVSISVSIKERKGKGRATNLWVRNQLVARDSQNSSQRELSWQHLRAIMALAPLTVQCMPDSFKRWPITVLQPASTTPDPTNKPWLRKSA